VRKAYEFSFEQIVASANDVIIVTKAQPIDGAGPEIVYVNEAFTRLTGYTAEEALGKTPRILQGPGTDPDARQRIHDALARGQPVRVEILNYSKTGEEYWLDLNIVPLRNDAGEITHFAAIERDLTQRKHEEAQLFQRATTDALTGIHNRGYFLERARSEFTRATRLGRPLAIIMFDVDQFKTINDTHGHEAGDKVLVRIVDTARSVLRQIDIFGRIGGEEFALALPEARLAEALSAAERLRAAIGRTPVTIGAKKLAVTASFGVSERRAADTAIEALLTRADRALYAAKAAGRNAVHSHSGV
jgi:diguanylate cyclase (GGDEF)-like protein/PAS domain S-box-containing protein